jgi:hypothetical protein
MSLLGRLARTGRGTDSKPLDYETQCIADQQYVQQTLAELEQAIRAKQEQIQPSPNQDKS